MFGLLLGPLAASATTWIVAAGGGGQFTDIQTAILVAQTGDVLLVQPGTYAPFALDRGLTLIGYGACDVSGTITIAGVPAGQTAAVVHIEASALDVQACDCPVIVQDTQQLVSISVSNSPDVRLARVLMPFQPSPSPTPPVGLELTGSRLELVASRIAGGMGADCATPAIQGPEGATCANSRLHMSRTRLLGGAGSSCAALNYYCGNGGVGLDLHAGADTILCGRPTDILTGGDGGGNWAYFSDCSFDGQMGSAVLLGSGAALRHSGVTIHDVAYYYGFHCVLVTGPGVQQAGGTEVQPAEADPTLDVSGNQNASGTLTFTLDAPAGSTALLYVGRSAVVVPDPNTLIEVLTPATIAFNLGQIPASGTATFTRHVSTLLPPGAKLVPGAKFFVQAEVSVAPGDLRRTNSIPVILR